MNFLCQKTELEELGNEELLQVCPEFGESIGKAFNSNNVISFTTELGEHLQEMDLYKASLLTKIWSRAKIRTKMVNTTRKKNWRFPKFIRKIRIRREPTADFIYCAFPQWLF